MLRVMLGTLATLSLCAASVLTASADTKDVKDTKATTKAHITKVDAKAGTVTVKMKDKDNKDVEKTYKLTEEIRYFDSMGKAIAVDEFQSGNDVLVFELDGKLKEMRKDKKATDTEKK